METDGRYETLSKKEIAQIEKEKRKLQKNLEGIRNMARLPDALFVVDTRKEKIAVDEARKLKIPGHRRRRHQLRSRTKSTTSSPATTTRCARSGCSRRASPTRSSPAAASASRRRPTTADGDGDDRGRRARAGASGPARAGHVPGVGLSALAASRRRPDDAAGVVMYSAGRRHQAGVVSCTAAGRWQRADA